MLLPCTAVHAEPAFTPHEDPSSAQSVLDAYSFLSQYVDVLTLMANRQYDNASKLAEQLSQITVPEDLSYIINRYNNITQQLINVLNDLQSTLDRASSLLDQYRLDEAAAELDRAGVLVAKAQILLGDLEDATTTLSQQLGVFAAPAESKIRQAYATLQNLINQLQDLIDQYHALLQRITQEEQELRAQQLEPTDLTLTLNTTNVFVGGPLPRRDSSHQTDKA
jgi:DNA repair exonuclease SbcCD ATPase subunit